ncbi:MAG: hypothetical protein HUJ56_07455, partial [Erysipelotrichaceae bacterium]|nr:hypothetical protein [Erysipelotrichaceae bacterium]
MRKSLTKLMVMSIIISLASCSKKVETYSLRDWLIKVDEELGLEDVVEDSGFYHITQEDSAYQAINNLVAWGVLDTTVNIDLDSDLTREWVAYTLVRMDGSELDAVSVKDSNESKFPKEIEKCVALGMMELDKRECFNPRKVVSKEEADDLLAMLIERINHREFEGYEEVTYTQEASNSILVHWVDKERGIVEEDERVEVGDLVQIWEDEEVSFYKVIGRNEAGLWVEVPLYEEVIDELEVEDTFTLDFSQVEVIDEEQMISIEELSSYTPNEDIVLCGIHKSGSKEINGFKIKYSLSGSSANVKINKKLEDGA